MEYLYGLLSGLGFIIILNNYIVFNIKNSLGDYNIISNTESNKILWNIFKICSTTKHKTLKLINTAAKYISTKKLCKNILFINNGNRTNNIIIKGNKPDYECLDTFVSECDLILYRIPSENNNIGYDLKRILINTDQKDISIDEQIKNYSCYKGKLHSPIVKLENDKGSYELDMKDDNYYVNGNIIYDTPFIKWILKEKHGISLSNTNKYTICYFDEDMCETELTSDEALHIDKDSIKKITTTCDNEADSTESSVEEESSGTGWLW